jgi:predicted RNase H-like HicB family nuclease
LRDSRRAYGTSRSGANGAWAARDRRARDRRPEFPGAPPRVEDPAVAGCDLTTEWDQRPLPGWLCGIMRTVERIERVTAVIEREGDGYVALCAELDIASQGDTIEDARANLQEALALFMETASPEEVAERFHSEVYVTGLDVVIG